MGDLAVRPTVATAEPFQSDTRENRYFVWIRLTAPPVDGAANKALIASLSEAFEIPRVLVTIVSGASSRTKVVELVGVTEERVRQLVEP